jgi:hypothetical protein
MANLKVSSQELDAILGELEGELNGILAGTQNKLTKAREEDGSPSPGMGSASASAGSPSAGSPSAGSPSAGGPPAAEGAPSAEGAPPAGAEPSAPPAGEPGMEGAPGGEPGMEGAPAGEPGMEGAPGGDAGAMDPQALEAEYAQLPLEELKAHYLAAKAALFAQMQGGGEAGAGGPPGAPPAGPSAGAPPPSPSAPPAGPPPGPSAGAPPMAMSEGKAVAGVSQSGNGGQLTKKNESDLQLQVEALTKIVTAFVNKPMQKAITGATYVAKSEDTAPRKLNSTEVTAKLSELTRSPDLKKSDRDLITGYYEGRTNLTAIEHLLK